MTETARRVALTFCTIMGVLALWAVSISLAAPTQSATGYLCYLPLVLGQAVPTSTPTPEILGTAYYFDGVNGSDSGTGALASPWKTIAKANSLSLRPGDRVLFKAGQTWTGTDLRPAHDGTAGKPIYYGRYGTGMNPRINHNSGYHPIFINERSWVTVDGIDVSDGAATCILVSNSDHVAIRNADVYTKQADASGVNSTASSDVLFDHITSSGISGWPISGETSTRVTISGSYLHDIVGGGSIGHHAIYFTNCSDLHFVDTIIDNSIHSGIKFTGVIGGFVIERVKLTNTCLDRENGSDFDFTQAVITSGTIQNCLLAFGRVCIATNGGTTHNLHLYNNTIVEHYFGIEMQSGATGWVVKNNIIVNDTAWSHSSSSLHTPLYVQKASDIANNTFDNNCYWFKNGSGSYNPIRVGSSTESLAAWQERASRPDVHSIGADPLFVNNYSDLHLRPNSPCPFAGVTTIPW